MSAHLTFVTPPPGLDPLVDFALTEVEGATGLYSMSAESRRLFLVDAAVHLPEYSPVITEEQSDWLGVTSSEDARLFVVANPAPTGTTVNLMAPIVVNRATGASAQLILEGQEWPLRAELVSRAAPAVAAPVAAAPVAV